MHKFNRWDDLRASEGVDKLQTIMTAFGIDFARLMEKQNCLDSELLKFGIKSHFERRKYLQISEKASPKVCYSILFSNFIDHLCLENLIILISDFQRSIDRLNATLSKSDDIIIRDILTMQFELTYEQACEIFILHSIHQNYLFHKLNKRYDGNLPQSSHQQPSHSDKNNYFYTLKYMQSLIIPTYDKAQASLIYRFVKTDGIKFFTELANKVRSWSM